MNKNYCFTFLLLLSTRFLAAQAPVIHSFSPLTGTVGTQVTIKGNHLSTITDSNTVYFGTVKAAVSAATDTSIAVTVPVGSLYSPINVRVDSFTAFSRLPFITRFGTGSSLLKNSFGNAIYVATAQFPALGDFDNDGFVDMASIMTGNKICVFKNTDSAGNRVYRSGTKYACVTNPIQVITADFNNDGKLDIVVAGSGSISIFKNISSNGNLLFQDLGFFSFSNSTNIFSIAAGDIDGDGKTDLVTSYDHSSTCFTVARNIGVGGNITFGARTNYAFGSVPGGSGTVGDGNKIYLADVDGDGKLDVSSVSRFYPPFLIFRNTSTPGAVSFASNVAITSNKNYSTGNGYYDLKLADIDGDNRPEILYVANDSLLFSFYRNTSSPGAISFTSKTSLPVSSYPVFIAVNDMNGDGKADAAVMSGGNVVIFQNNSQPGSLAFKASRAYPAVSLMAIALADMDADGKVDIVVSGNYFASIVPYKTYILTNVVGETGPVTLCTRDSTAAIESDIEGSTYQWQVNTGNGFADISEDTIYFGTNAAALQVSHMASSWAGYQYRCLVDGNYSTVQFLKFTALFNGSLNSAWENINNWDCRQLPDSNTDVIINSANTVLGSNTQVRSIEVRPGCSLFVKQPYTLQVTH